MSRRSVCFAVLAGLMLAGTACRQYVHQELSFRAPAVVTIGGLYDPGRMVSFSAYKLKESGAVVTGSLVLGDRFTDLLGYADFVFGYNLEYDDEDQNGMFMEGTRVLASVEYNGTLYADTVAVVPPFQWPFGERITDTLRINLPTPLRGSGFWMGQ